MNSELVEFVKYNTEEDSNIDYYDILFGLIDREFIFCPFTVSLPREMLIALDDVFTMENVIIIKDRRPSFNYPQGHKKAKVNWLSIRAIDHNTPMTLRYILNEMSGTNHYMNFIQTDHIFLEGLRKDCEVQYTCEWGS